MKSIVTLLVGICLCSFAFAQNLLPSPFAYPSCISFASPTGWTNCTGSPDCAASRCTVPAGCTGQGVMCFGESFYYMLPSPLVIGQSYTISMNACVGILGGQSIISGLHNFMVIGLTSAPTNCLSANYGAVCATPGATTLLSGTMSSIGWQNFTNTFTAVSAIRWIVIGNCDNTGNGGNLFCSPSLTTTVILPVEVAGFDVQASGCEVNAAWSVTDDDAKLDHFELRKSTEGRDEIVATVMAERNRRDYTFTDQLPALQADYQLQLIYRDGSQSQSEVMHVASTCEGQHSAIEGNPVHGGIATLRFESDGSAVDVSIFDVGGRLVRSETMTVTEAGWHRQGLNVSGLLPGAYFVRIGNGDVLKMQLMP